MDFLLQREGQVYPVEVKAGSAGRLRSLHFFMLKKNAGLAIRIHSGKANIESLQANYSGQQKAFKLLNLPFYMVDLIPRLILEFQDSNLE